MKSKKKNESADIVARPTSGNAPVVVPKIDPPPPPYSTDAGTACVTRKLVGIAAGAAVAVKASAATKGARRASGLDMASPFVNALDDGTKRECGKRRRVRKLVQP